MILPDLNLLIHAYNADSPFHKASKVWWEALMNDAQPVGLAWAVILGFIRISTHRRILSQPLPVTTACGHARAWLGQPQVTILHPGSRHVIVGGSSRPHRGGHECGRYSTTDNTIRDGRASEWCTALRAVAGSLSS